MASQLLDRLAFLDNAEGHALLRGIQRGIEKESLRVDRDGRLSGQAHPAALGSALTHGQITTDYSEALLEFITPVNTGVEDSLAQLEDVHRFVCSNIGDEVLWAASMPCVVAGDDSIPVARYGSSNVARMKTVYRYGLGHRYGRLMQTIAGIHYNFSMPTVYWERCWQRAGEPDSLCAFTTGRYLDLIRNFRRHSWLLVYLFGASPAVCASFLKGRDDHGLEPFDPEGKSLHLPWATSLRMGDLGYNSAAQKSLDVCYNSLDSYIETLRGAIMQPHPAYAEISCGANGDYQQLNNSLLQIENEFYSPVRPKRVAFSGEPPLKALRRAGVEYIEVRCVDVSPFSPIGLDAEQVRFMDSFLLHCLLADSPLCEDGDNALQARNLAAIVNRGRQPGLALETAGGEESMQAAASRLLAEIDQIAGVLDRSHGGRAYRDSVAAQAAKVERPELTPSARVLREMREQDVPFFRLAMNYSLRWAEYFRSRPLPAEQQLGFARESERSLAAQREIEADDELSFDEYLANFYDQYQQL